MSLMQRWSERNTDEDPNVLWATEYNPPKPWWEVAVATKWNDLRFGVEFYREYGTGAFRVGDYAVGAGWPDLWHLMVSFGPWSIWLKREWGNPL